VDVFLSLTSSGASSDQAGAAVALGDVKANWEEKVRAVEAVCEGGRGEKKAVESLRTFGRR
jgi:hypothetical protein